MFENQTFEVILQRMLDRVSDGMDKREGSVIYDALAPAAVELASAYIAFDSMLQETFGDTASREYLLRLCAERGIEPYAATKTICAVSFTGAEVPVGNRFSGGETTYEYIGNNRVICEEAGAIGNEHIGTIIPIEYVPGLQTASITEIEIYGEDEESTENLRKRYFESFDANGYGGNRRDYEVKSMAIGGVGLTKVTPIWNGPGSVKLTILNSEFRKASDFLVELVQNTFDPYKDGMGDGLAPIGHIVTVDTVTEVPINISTTITYENGYSLEKCVTEIKNAIESYLLTLITRWMQEDVTVVRISQIETAILSASGVIDVTGTTINDSTQNISLSKYEIPIVGVINNA